MGTKLEDLPEQTTSTNDDILYVVDGTTSKKTTRANLFKGKTVVTVGASSTGADYKGWNHEPLQAAIDYLEANGGGEIKLLAGSIYPQETVTISGSVPIKLTGEGDSSRLAFENGAGLIIGAESGANVYVELNSIYLTTSGASDFLLKLRNKVNFSSIACQYRGNSNTTSVIEVMTDGDYLVGSSGLCYNIYFNNCQVSNGNNGVYIHTTNDGDNWLNYVCMTNCMVMNNQTQLKIEGLGTGETSHHKFIGCYFDCDETKDLLVMNNAGYSEWVGCSFDGVAAAETAQIRLDANSRYNFFTGCTFDSTFEVLGTHNNFVNSPKIDLYDDANFQNDVTVEGEITTAKITGDEFLQATDAPLRQNLGTPSITEMALFEQEFDNKTEFYGISNLTVETLSGEKWTDISSSISDTNKKKLLGGDSLSTGFNFTNASIDAVRLTLRNDGSYVYLNAVYGYWSPRSNTAKILIEKKRDDGDWITVKDDGTYQGGWPSHFYLPFTTIPWKDPVSSSSQYETVRVTFTIDWAATSDFEIYNLSLWGGYPKSRRRHYFLDENGKATFDYALACEDDFTAGGNLTVTDDLTVSGNINGPADLVTTGEEAQLNIIRYDSNQDECARLNLCENSTNYAGYVRYNGEANSVIIGGVNNAVDVPAITINRDTAATNFDGAVTTDSSLTVGGVLTNNATDTGTYNKISNSFVPTLANGRYVQYSFGVESSSRNCAEFTYYYASDGNASNFVQFGLHSNQAIKCLGNGNTEILNDLNVLGDITLTGTVDGIDIATDVAANTAKVSSQWEQTDSSTLSYTAAGNQFVRVYSTNGTAGFRMKNADNEYHFETDASRYRIVESGVDYPFVINNSPGNVEVNRTLAVTGDLTVSGSTTLTDALYFNDRIVGIVASDNYYDGLNSTTYRARGTSSSKDAVEVGDYTGGYNCLGWDGDSYTAAGSIICKVAAVSNNDITTDIVYTVTGTSGAGEHVFSGGNVVVEEAIVCSTTPTIETGTAAPATTPAKVGDVFVDTSNKKLYFATGTTNSSDWTIAN